MIGCINYILKQSVKAPNIMKYVIIQITYEKPFEKQATRMCFVYS